MGLLVECPKCRKRNSERAKVCKCGFALSKFSGRVWWIEYYLDGHRKRERIGPNKAAAEQRLREVLSARAEGRHIRKSPDATTRFADLAKWYLDLPGVKAKRSYSRDVQTLKRHLLPFFGARLLKDITPAQVDAYRQKRLSEPSGRSPKNLTCPATVNREIACLKTIFNKAVKDGRAEHNPCQGLKMLKENNERNRVLSPEEYARLLAHCPSHLKPVVKLAYHTGMRQGEILSLTWGQVDLREGFIHLRPENCKTQEGRAVPLSRELVEILKSLRQGLPMPHMPVFTYAGRSVGSIKRSFATAVRKAGIEDFTFHDLRHTYINNRRLEGHDYFRIMAATGHKTLSVFKRYNTVSKEELKALVGEKTGSDGHQYGHQGMMDTKQQAVTP